MTTHSDTQVVLLTPPGRGAVATVLVAGPLATRIAAELVHRPGDARLDDAALGTIALGRWGCATGGEEVVVSRTHSERVEIHCHGGDAAAAAIIASLVQHGCQQVTWQDWLRESEPDAIAAAARIALASAGTARVAAILWDQYAGALRSAFDWVDAQAARGDVAAALGRVEELLSRWELGRHLIEPWRIVLAGRPNVGKSSLINALVGYERAIVHATPGTTRDVVTAAAAFDGWPVELSDTAGLRSSDEPLETAGVGLARAALATADLVVLVFDASSAGTDEDEALTKDWPLALRVFNKCDLVEAGLPVRWPDRLAVSAKTGAGLDELRQAIVRRLVPHPPSPGEAVPFAADQIATVRRLRSSLSAAPSPQVR